jgi:hypothetical protein
LTLKSTFINSKVKCNLTSSLIGFKLLRGFFYFKEYPDERKVKLMAIKLKKYMLSYNGRILRSKGLVRAEVRSSLRNR